LIHNVFNVIGGCSAPATRGGTRDLINPATGAVHGAATEGSELPHGGFGSSGYGKDLGSYGLDDYTRIKHVAHAW
jgi:Aldehyde dehydrogenase family